MGHHFTSIAGAVPIGGLSGRYIGTRGANLFLLVSFLMLLVVIEA